MHCLAFSLLIQPLPHIFSKRGNYAVQTLSSCFCVVGLALAPVLACTPASPSLSPAPQGVASNALYMPRGVAAAFRKGTRSPDGRPGPNYWQNRGRYDIQVSALPPNRTIRGSEQITYFNNSPDTLRNPNFKFLVNIHKPGAPRGFGASADYLTSGVHIDTLKVNGQVVPWPGNVNTFKTVISPSPDGTTAAFTLQYPHPVDGLKPTAISAGAQLQVSLDGIVQEPGSDYTATGAALTMTSPPPAGARFWAVWFANEALT